MVTLFGSRQDAILGDEKSERRAAKRFVPDHLVVSMTLRDGQCHTARVRDISRDSIALEADFAAIRPTAVTLVGFRAVRLVRVLRNGAVFRFLVRLPAFTKVESVL